MSSRDAAVARPLLLAPAQTHGLAHQGVRGPRLPHSVRLGLVAAARRHAREAAVVAQQRHLHLTADAAQQVGGLHLGLRDGALYAQRVGHGLAGAQQVPQVPGVLLGTVRAHVGAQGQSRQRGQVPQLGAFLRREAAHAAFAHAQHAQHLVAQQQGQVDARLQPLAAQRRRIGSREARLVGVPLGDLAGEHEAAQVAALGQRHFRAHAAPLRAAVPAPEAHAHQGVALGRHLPDVGGPGVQGLTHGLWHRVQPPRDGGIRRHAKISTRFLPACLAM